MIKASKNNRVKRNLFIDKSYNGKAFELDQAFFADELLPKKSKKNVDAPESIKEELKKAGLAPGLIRLSIGIEHIDDILEDINQALSKAFEKVLIVMSCASSSLPVFEN